MPHQLTHPCLELCTDRWVKAGLHCHTVESDGGLTPEATVARYRELGYQCVGITDHLAVTPAEHLSTADMLVIDATENGGDPDIIGVGVQAAIAAGAPLNQRAQALAEQGGFTIAAHPTYCGAAADVYLACPQLMAMEILNAYCDEAYCNGYATELWDMVLGRGRRIWGVASDDAHLNPRKAYYSDAGQAWVQIQTAELTRHAVLAALKCGAFYATQGPHFHTLSADGQSIELTCTPVQQVRWRTFGSAGSVQRADTPSGISQACLPVGLGLRGYVRIELVDAQGLRAWSNPLFLEAGGSDPRGRWC